MATRHTDQTPAARASYGDAARIITLVAGIAFLAVGIIGFALTGFGGNWADPTNHHVFGLFMVNPLHNLVHLALGVLGVVMWRTTRSAVAFGWLNLVGYGAAFVYGLFAVGQDWDFLSINAADNVLHFVLAAVGLAIIGLGQYALIGDRTAMSGRSTFNAPGRGHGAPA